jgi:ribosome-associated toxin RatA of RatAB toxin-antitoxin module
LRKTAAIERVFDFSPERVFAAYWDLLRWPTVLSNVLEVRVRYDDGVHQDFEMVVDNGGTREVVRGARVGIPFRRIELCQFLPPPGFRIMRGEWRFEPVDAGTIPGTRVAAERTFALEDPNAEGDVARALEAVLAASLAKFDTYLAAGNGTCASSR